MAMAPAMAAKKIQMALLIVIAMIHEIIEGNLCEN
jgi:hypothetical protein